MHSSAEFRYDRLSYSLNFKDEGNFNNFSFRVPLSLVMVTEPAMVISTYIRIIRLDTKSGRDFIAPCKCRDTSKYVHRECPNQWRSAVGSIFNGSLFVLQVMALLGYSVYKIDAHQRFWLRLHCGFGSELGFCYVCGEVLDFCAKSIILKLADWMIVASGGAYDTKNLQECIGSAVIAMGPEKLFAIMWCHLLCPSNRHHQKVFFNDHVLFGLHQTENENLDLVLEFKCKYSYSKKSAGKNIKALASCFEEWLQALVNVFFESSPAKYQQFKAFTGVPTGALTYSFIQTLEQETKLTYERLLMNVETMKERFAKLLLGEDVTGESKGVSTALALSNAITYLAVCMAVVWIKAALSVMWRLPYITYASTWVDQCEMLLLSYGEPCRSLGFLLQYQFHKFEVDRYNICSWNLDFSTVADVKDANKRGPLIFAAREGNTDLCKYLVEELMTDVNEKDEQENLSQF
ncbi:hypothetical protein FXO38_20342 [Capsicum annuum]|nr:hypothetical protein FXO38_20342 [Capsicum annuum]